MLQENDEVDIYTALDLSWYESMNLHLASQYVQIPNPKLAISQLIQNFSKTQDPDHINEYGLLNRLDNDTAGFLYFAKTPSIFDQIQLQAQNKIEKHYIAQIQGEFDIKNLNVKFRMQNLELCIDYPIMHRSTEKMIAILPSEDQKKTPFQKNR